jgi:TolB-like protein
MADIFLSYNREDQATAQRFAKAFEAQGFSVWWDVTLRSGEAYDQVTEEALKTAKAVVVLWSKRSVASRWVRAEATLADRNRTLVPARTEACDLPIMFELTQTADLSHWTGEDTDPAWRTFLADVRRFVEAAAAPQPPRPPVSAAAAAPPTHGNRPSIAVLPFINRSGLQDDDIFADGMVGDLTAALSLSRRMKVVAASATAIYRKGARDLHQIGRELGVRYLMEGNVRRVGSDLRVSAQLVEAEDGDILWTRKFDRPLAELSGLQEDLVTEVAACLGVEVQRAEMEHALRKPGDITAWEAVLRAEASLSNRPTLSGAEAAIADARRAIEIDPDYVAAYAILAVALSVHRILRGGEDAASAREVLAAVARARAFESNDPIALARIAVALHRLGKHQEALPIAEHAVALNPNLELPRLALGQILMQLGRWDEAITEYRAMERLAPNGIWSHGSYFLRSIAHFYAGRYEQALEAVDQSLRLRPSAPTQAHRIFCLARLGRWEEARDAVRVFCDANAKMPFPVVEKLVRNALYMGMEPTHVEECVATVRKLWAETGGEA